VRAELARRLDASRPELAGDGAVEPVARATRFSRWGDVAANDLFYARAPNLVLTGPNAAARRSRPRRSGCALLVRAGCRAGGGWPGDCGVPPAADIGDQQTGTPACRARPSDHAARDARELRARHALLSTRSCREPIRLGGAPRALIERFARQRVSSPPRTTRK
jgi:hypothetical protein